MSEQTPLLLSQVIGYVGFLWLGLYAIVRGDRRGSAILMSAAALCASCFFVAGAILTLPMAHSQTIALHRLTWWPDVVAVALWFSLSVRLGRWWDRPVWRLLSTWVVGITAALLVVLGTAANLVNDYSGMDVRAGPLYPLYVLYVVAATGAAVVSLGGSNRRLGDGRGSMILPVGAACFLVGAGYLAVKVFLGTSAWPELPAYILLLCGLGTVAVTIAVRGAFVLGQDVRRDIAYSGTGLVLLVAAYGVADWFLVGNDTAAHGVFLLVLLGLVTLGFAAPDLGRALLDRLFFTPTLREEREAARGYAEALSVRPVGTHPDLATRKVFDTAVRRAVTHLSDPTKLAATPLLNLVIVAQGVVEQGLHDTRLSRAAVLREILLELLDGLRPDGVIDPDDEGLRYYNCLYYPYVRGLNRHRALATLRQLKSRRQADGSPRTDVERALEWLTAVPEDTFYKWQRRGSDTIAATLRERERSAGGAVPRDADADMAEGAEHEL